MTIHSKLLFALISQLDDRITALEDQVDDMIEQLTEILESIDDKNGHMVAELTEVVQQLRLVNVRFEESFDTGIEEIDV